MEGRAHGRVVSGTRILPLARALGLPRGLALPRALTLALALTLRLAPGLGCLAAPSVAAAEEASAAATERELDAVADEALRDELLEWEAPKPSAGKDDAGAQETPAPAGQEASEPGEPGAPDTAPLEWSFDWRNGLWLREPARGRYVHIGGRLVVDGGGFWLADGLKLASESGWDAEAKVRQARLFAQGLVLRKLLFKVEFDFADTEFKDVWIGWNDVGPLGTVRIGYFKESFSLEEQTGFRGITFMERSLVNALAPKRNVGLATSSFAYEGALHWSAGAFRVIDSVRDSEDLRSGSDAWEATARIAGTPIWQRDGARALVVGLSAAASFDIADPIQIAQRPESFLVSPLVETPDIQDISEGWRLGGELAWIDGPLSVQSELIANQLVRDDGQPDLLFWGGYAQVSRFLTGERRVYGRRSGRFGRVVPKRPFDFQTFRGGAVEIAARLSYLDLTSKDVRGGIEWNTTLGLNWFPRSNTRLAFNAIYARVAGQGDAAIFQARAYVDF